MTTAERQETAYRLIRDVGMYQARREAKGAVLGARLVNDVNTALDWAFIVEVIDATIYNVERFAPNDGV